MYACNPRPHACVEQECNKNIKKASTEKTPNSPHSLLLLVLVSLLLDEPALPPPIRPELELVLLVSPSLAHPEDAAPPPKSLPFSASASHSASVSLVDWRGSRTSMRVREVTGASGERNGRVREMVKNVVRRRRRVITGRMVAVVREWVWEESVESWEMKEN